MEFSVILHLGKPKKEKCKEINWTSQNKKEKEMLKSLESMKRVVSDCDGTRQR